ncbi:integrase arm-type DNA-binding domain-containing protein [Achromobacter marplatensis]|uniref:tyrosine-type recombinase/integrase n=1 Tax=Achromobacter marplatensis TaxID=470868 RepID=UPI0028E8AEB0|nr:integrase arm-type DNA-binding domain-containing protein [Achromobacter marplatensis]
MAQNVLSDRKVVTAKPRDKEYLLADGEGLNLRVRPDGSRLWLFRYTSAAGKPAKKSLGPYPSVSLLEARQKAAQMRQQLQKGIDPGSTVEGQPATVQELFETWVRDSLSHRRNAKGVYACQSRMGRHILKAAGNDRIGSLTKARILDLLAPIVRAGKGPQANCVLIDVKQMLAYATEREWIEANPAMLIKKSSVGGKDVVRDRVLDGEEIKMLRDKLLAATGLTITAHAAYWIALSTMARAGEIAAIRESEVDWDAREWTIPAAKNKSNREHVIQLSDFAFYWLTVLRQQVRPGDYLIPGKGGIGHVSYRSFSHQATMRQDSASGHQGLTVRGELSLPGGAWTTHDLRRTGATIMGEMGIAENVVEKCLNHAEQTKLVKVYQRQKMLPQRREAFDMLGAHLTKLLGDPNIWGPARVLPGRGKVVHLRAAS